MFFVERYWENPDILHVNCEKPHAYFIPFQSEEKAEKGIRGNSGYYQSLNGIWKFKYHDSVYEVEDGFMSKDFDASGGIILRFLPGCIQQNVPQYGRNGREYSKGRK